jgi:hypothetical protein
MFVEKSLAYVDELHASRLLTDPKSAVDVFLVLSGLSRTKCVPVSANIEDINRPYPYVSIVEVEGKNDKNEQVLLQEFLIIGAHGRFRMLQASLGETAG